MGRPSLDSEQFDDSGWTPKSSPEFLIRKESRQLLRMITRKYYPVYMRAGLTREEAEELISNVALKFFKSCHKVIKSEDAYLNRIATNELYSYIRKKAALKRSFIQNFDDPNTVEEVPAEEDIEEESDLQLEHILPVLIPRQQEIVKLLLAGYSKVDIAVEIDIKPSTVSYHIKKLSENELLQALLTKHKGRRDKEGNRDD